MAESSSFKSYARGQRNIVTEEPYASGIMYSNNPLDEGYARLLVNMDYKDDSKTIAPRPGFQQLFQDTFTSSDTYMPCAAFTSNVNIKDEGSLVKDYRAKC